MISLQWTILVQKLGTNNEPNHPKLYPAAVWKKIWKRIWSTAIIFSWGHQKSYRVVLSSLNSESVSKTDCDAALFMIVTSGKPGDEYDYKTKKFVNLLCTIAKDNICFYSHEIVDKWNVKFLSLNKKYLLIPTIEL